MDLERTEINSIPKEKRLENPVSGEVEDTCNTYVTCFLCAEVQEGHGMLK